MFNKATGGYKSPVDVRDFKFGKARAKQVEVPVKGGERWNPDKDDDQFRVGICSSMPIISMAEQHWGKPFSNDFQYLLQKRYFDNDYYPSDPPYFEGSSSRSSLTIAYKYGFLPQEHFEEFVTDEDRKLPYPNYIEKLKAIPKEKIQELLEIAKDYRIIGYERVTDMSRDGMAAAIIQSQYGLVTRYGIGQEWWVEPIEPLRRPRKFISGHIVRETNFNGDSFRLANWWGQDWADKGTAYRLHSQYRPTEAWIPYFSELPKEVEKQKEDKKKIKGKILQLLQIIIELIRKL